ncbi:MAG: helix-turn-helix domain-containing protein [Paracoccaceae bacterium]
MGTVAKAMSLIGLFARSTPELGLSELARRSGLNKTTTYRLMSELAAQGFVEQVGTGRAYRLGPAFLRLAALREQAVPMRETVQAVVTEPGGGHRRDRAFLAARRRNALDARLCLQPGARHFRADGRCRGAHLPWHQLRHGRARLLPARLRRPGAQRTACGAHARDGDRRRGDPRRPAGVRRSGVAVSVGGFEVDVFSHAAPVFDNTARVVGAVAVAAPVTRMSDALAAQVKRAVIDSARHLTRLTGGFLPPGFPAPDPARPTETRTAPMPERTQS